VAKPTRAYVDTSVIGGAEDEEFQDASRRLLTQVRQGKFVLVVSTLTLRELAQAPEAVRQVLGKLPPGCIEEVPAQVEQQADELAALYVSAGVLGPARLDDATHVAIATLAGADLILSWNFRHIVNVIKIGQFNRVNAAHGHPEIDIRSPLEVIYGDEDEDL